MARRQQLLGQLSGLRAINVQIPDSCIVARLAVPATSAPGALRLSVSSANPARDAVELRYVLPRAAQVRLEVFELRGARVATLAQGAQASGEHVARWMPAAAVAPGIYLARLRAEGVDRIARIVRVR